MLQSLSDCNDSWVALLADDFVWLKNTSPRRNELPGGTDVDTWIAFVQAASKQKWKSIVCGAVSQSVALQRTRFFTQQALDGFVSDCLEAGIAGQQHVQIDAGASWSCDIAGCDAEFASLQALKRHKATEHAVLSVENWFVWGHQCLGCLTTFQDRNACLRHMKRAKFCLNRCIANLDPVDTRDAGGMRDNTIKQGCVRFQGPPVAKSGRRRGVAVCRFRGLGGGPHPRHS